MLGEECVAGETGAGGTGNGLGACISDLSLEYGDGVMIYEKCMLEYPKCRVDVSGLECS